MNLILQRRTTILGKCTFGDLMVDLVPECVTLEDKVREVPGMPVASWKIHGATAIPKGRYEILLVDSPKHGKDTMRLQGVPGFDYVDIHSVSSVDDTDGCIGVGDTPNYQLGTLAGGLAHDVLKNLKIKIVAAIHAQDRVFIDIRNPE